MLDERTLLTVSDPRSPVAAAFRVAWPLSSVTQAMCSRMLTICMR